MDAQAAPVARETGPELVYIPPENLSAIWPLIEPMVPGIIERARGRISFETMMHEVATRKLHIWTVWDGNDIRALVGVTIGTSPTGLKIATVEFAAGSESHTWLHLMAELEDKCREIGCHKIEMHARKGWARKLQDYKMTHVFLEKDL